MSISNILIRRLLLATLILVGGGSWLSYQQIQHETQELFDAQLARSARLISSLVQADSGQLEFSTIQKFLDENKLIAEGEPKTDNILDDIFDDDDEELTNGHIYETKLGFQIWDEAGNLILKSSNLPVIEISSQATGFSDNYFSDNNWRVFSLTSSDGLYRCVTAERIDVREDLIGEIFEGLLQFFIVLVPVLLITLWFAIRQGLEPLQSLTSQIQSRGAERLDSISQNDAPEEIRTITDALNQLLSKLGNALAREKRVVSDAAHELRTPLAAVKLHAELASKANNAEDRKSSIKHVLEGIDRTTHLVNQLLTLARLSPESFAATLQSKNIQQLMIDEVALQAPLAEDKDIDLSISDSTEVVASVDETSLRLLIGNLLNNAISYTQPGGAINLKLYTHDNEFALVVEDNGPGIPLEERSHVLDRFYRLQNHDQTGCGIGLSIVMQVVDLHQAKLMLAEPNQGPGLKVTVTFPIR